MNKDKRREQRERTSEINIISRAVTNYKPAVNVQHTIPLLMSWKKCNFLKNQKNVRTEQKELVLFSINLHNIVFIGIFFRIKKPKLNVRAGRSLVKK